MVCMGYIFFLEKRRSINILNVTGVSFKKMEIWKMVYRTPDDNKKLVQWNAGKGGSHWWGKEIFHGRTKGMMFVEFKDVHTWDNRSLRYFCYYISHFGEEEKYER